MGRQGPIRDPGSLLYKALALLFLLAYYLAVGMAELGGFIVKARSLLLYAVLIVGTIFFPLLGIVLVGSMFMWLNRKYWDPWYDPDPA